MKTALIIIAAHIPLMLLTLWAILDAAKREFGTTGKKVLWLLLAAIPYVGFLVYFIFGCRKEKKPV